MLGKGEDGVTSHLHDGGLLAQGDLAQSVLHVIGQATHEVVDAEGFGDLLQFLIGGGGLAHSRLTNLVSYYAIKNIGKRNLVKKKIALNAIGLKLSPWKPLMILQKKKPKTV